MDLQLQTYTGGTAVVSARTFAALRDGLRGEVCLPSDPGYDTARTVWNAMIDRRPAIIVQAESAADVARTVDFVRDHRAVLSIHGGGHNIAGNAVCDGGVMLHLSRMRNVQVDPALRRARVAAGALLADVDRATQVVGLAVPVGVNSKTGIAGLTLGGGYGWTSRKLGLTIDSLVSAEIVTADGQIRHADADQNADLFWALRGGGGNFGVVTSFEFALHRFGPQVLAGLLVHPLDQGTALLDAYCRLVAAAPDALTSYLIARKAPPIPSIPQRWHGEPIITFSLCYCGDVAEGQEAIAPFRVLGKPVADLVAATNFVEWQPLFDAMTGPGARNYWKSHNLTSLTEAAGRVVIGAASDLPSDESYVVVAQTGGQISRVPDGATAFASRDVQFVVSIHARWHDAAQDGACIAWARRVFSALAPHAAGSVYVNYMTDDEAERIQSAYGAHLGRLAEVKRYYDPANLFRMNQNIGGH